MQSYKVKNHTCLRLLATDGTRDRQPCGTCHIFNLNQRVMQKMPGADDEYFTGLRKTCESYLRLQPE